MCASTARQTRSVLSRLSSYAALSVCSVRHCVVCVLAPHSPPGFCCSTFFPNSYRLLTLSPFLLKEKNKSLLILPSNLVGKPGIEFSVQNNRFVCAFLITESVGHVLGHPFSPQFWCQTHALVTLAIPAFCLPSAPTR